MTPPSELATRVDGVLLAAGAGRRAGGPKGLRRDGSGVAWVRRCVEVLLDGGCDRVLVVVGAAGDEVAALLDDPRWPRRADVVAVPCADWAVGMSASLAAGLRSVTADAAVVHLVDLPDVPAAAVARVLDHGGRTPDVLARATYEGRPGHPVLVGADHLAPLLATLEGDRGARSYLDAHRAPGIECGDLATGVDDDVPDVRA
ncbi:MAG: nucleotidyltransferase family protein, partial [Janthinobacterium lividum]